MEIKNRKRILIVDDDIGTAMLHCKCLERRGFAVVSAASSEGAMQVLRGEEVQLILLDHRLSDGTTGIEFCESLKALGRSVPVVIVTGFSQEQTAVEALRAGVRDYVTKSPSYLDHLPDAVERVLRQVDVERQLAESEARLAAMAQKMEAVSTMAGGIAHQFNNLLQAIQGYATFALQGLSADEQRFEDLQQLLKAVRQATALTQQVLGVGRSQSLQLAEVDLNQLVGDLVTMIRPLIGSRINIAFTREDDLGTVLADADQLRQMLMSLCVNARDAMPQGGNLLLRTELRTIENSATPTRPKLSFGRYVVVSVRDDGSGMTEHVKEHLFEPFFTTKEVGQGIGLGLAMVYGSVQQHGGAIDVKSEPGRGTTVEIYLPSQGAAKPTSRSDGLTRNGRDARPASVPLPFIDQHHAVGKAGAETLGESVP